MQYDKKVRLAILASGGGSNAEKIIEYFNESPDIEVALIVSNRKKAYVLERAFNHNIPFESFSKSDFEESDSIIECFEKHRIDYIILAGFLLLVPPKLIQKFPKRIINIHPALLPKYGGKGMYGQHVHQAVFDNEESETGMSIHFVNEHFDEGKIIAQFKTSLQPNDTPEIIAKKVLSLEHRYYAPVIEKVVLERQILQNDFTSQS